MNRKYCKGLITLAGLAFFLTSCGTAPQTTHPPTERPPAERPSGGTGKPYKVFGKEYYPLLSAEKFKQTGVASWYGEDFHGRKTSNGEIYDMFDATAAHKTLPFNTLVKVTNLETGMTTKVRINDRGPFVKDRIIDLSYKAAHEIGIHDKGTATVEVEALGIETQVVENGHVSTKLVQPESYDKGSFTIQIGSFLVRENADRLRNIMAENYQNAHIVVYDTGADTFYRVRVTHATKLAEAMENQRELENRGYSDSFVVAE